MKKVTKTLAAITILTSLVLGACKKKDTTDTNFLGTYVGTYNNGAGTTNKPYTYIFLNSTEMEVYDGTVATGAKAVGKYVKSGTTITGKYKYLTTADSVSISATMPNETTFTLNGTWTVNNASGQFSISKQ
jgi:hypothetical protein